MKIVVTVPNFPQELVYRAKREISLDASIILNHAKELYENGFIWEAQQIIIKHESFDELFLDYKELSDTLMDFPDLSDFKVEVPLIPNTD